MATKDAYRLNVDFTFATQITTPGGKTAFIPFFGLASTDGTPLGTVGNPLVTSGGGGGSGMSQAEFLAALRSTATRSTVNSGATSVTLLASNANRKGATIVNTDANTLYVSIAGGTATLADIPILTGGYYEVPYGITGAITGIWGADGTGVSTIYEAA